MPGLKLNRVSKRGPYNQLYPKEHTSMKKHIEINQFTLTKLHWNLFLHIPAILSGGKLNS